MSDTASNEQMESKLCKTAEQLMYASILPLECNQTYMDLNISLVVHVDFGIIINYLDTVYLSGSD
jgi:hypothetical protein